MTSLGVHSEVGELRKVIVHRPDLSLKRLTPGNHDELLFDDVLWVERAQWEHDQFVARMRERGVEVLLRPGPAERGTDRQPGGSRPDHLARGVGGRRRAEPRRGRPGLLTALPPDALAAT